MRRLIQVLERVRNELGINGSELKGVGEVGAIGLPLAVKNAIVDMLSDLRASDVSVPAPPAKVWNAIKAAKTAG